MQQVYSVNVGIQWLLDRPLETFKVKTLAASKEDAEINIRERFRHAYYVQIKEVK